MNLIQAELIMLVNPLFSKRFIDQSIFLSEAVQSNESLSSLPSLLYRTCFTKKVLSSKISFNIFFIGHTLSLSTHLNLASTLPPLVVRTKTNRLYLPLQKQAVKLETKTSLVVKTLASWFTPVISLSNSVFSALGDVLRYADRERVWVPEPPGVMLTKLSPLCLQP